MKIGRGNNSFYLMIFVALFSCNSQLKVDNGNVYSRSHSLEGEWGVDIPESIKGNKEIKLSTIRFNVNSEFATKLFTEISELDENTLASLGIINVSALSLLEGGWMVQYPSECIKIAKSSAPEIPFVYIQSSNDSILILKVTADERFMSVNLSLESHRLDIELNPVTNLTLFRSNHSHNRLSAEVIKNDVSFNNLQGEIKSISTLTYDSNERNQNINGKLEREDIQLFSASGDMLSEKSTIHYYNNREFNITYMGRFGDRKLIKSSDTISQVLVGDTLKTYLKGGMTSTYYSGNCKHYSNPLGIETITCYDNENGRIKEVNKSAEGEFTTVSSIDMKDEFGNWLRLTSYESSGCTWKKKKIRLREIEYYR